ncbi:hypothetical protein Tco_1009857, partial [Tanacetum coccineum]
MDSGLVVPSFLPSDDPIASLNKAMAFISTAFTSRYPLTNNQLRTSSNLRNQAAIQDGRVIVSDKGYSLLQLSRKGHMARQCTKPKRPRNSTWFKEKAMLAEALESEMVLDEEQMAFLEDNEDTITTVQQSQEIPTPATFQTNDLDTFAFDCDETPSARVVLMVKFSSYDTSFSAQQDAMIMSVIKEMSNQVAKCNVVDKANKAVNESLTAELERYKEQIKNFEERLKFDLNDREKYIDGQLRKKELLLENDRLLELLIYQDLVHTAMNSLAEILDYQSMEKSFLDEYSECVELKAELS